MTTTADTGTGLMDALGVEMARRDFASFLSFVHVIDPPPAGKGIIPFVAWPHLMDLAGALVAHRLLVVLKARQLGVSWLLAAYALWTALSKDGAVVLLLSKSEPDAKDFLDKCKAVYDHLPPMLQRPITKKNETELEFGGHSAGIYALASTEEAGRSKTATLVIQDEADFHEWLDANYTAIKPTIDAGGQLVQASTSNKKKMTSLFKGLYRGAPGNGYARRFYGWKSRPGRDQRWYAAVKASVPATEKLSPDQFMEQEYPATEEEALAPSKARMYFDRDAVAAMLADCEEPRETQLANLIRIWKKPVVGRKYVVGADTAWGSTGSANAAIVMDWQTGEQVAEVYGRPHPDEMAGALHKVCRMYNDAFLLVERAGQGQERDSESVVIVDKMVELGYGAHMYHRKDDWKTVEKNRGWITDAFTRPLMLGELEEAVRLGYVRPKSRAAVGEFMAFIRDEKGRPQAAEGALDDYVMAWAMTWQARKHARFSIPKASGTAVLSAY